LGFTPNQKLHTKGKQMNTATFSLKIKKEILSKIESYEHDRLVLEKIFTLGRHKKISRSDIIRELLYIGFDLLDGNKETLVKMQNLQSLIYYNEAKDTIISLRLMEDMREKINDIKNNEEIKNMLKLGKHKQVSSGDVSRELIMLAMTFIEYRTNQIAKKV
jgi:hypothetical protein